MGTISLMLSSWWEKIVDFVTGLLAFIPQFMYFLYTCMGSFLDFLQYLIRKLAGLDVYYVNGEAVEGDIVVSFVRGVLGIDKAPQYSSLTTVFWSMVIFGCVLLILTTIFSIIKAHYNYDAKKSHPMTIIASSLKSLALMAIVPVVAIFGLYLSQIVLQALDTLTTDQSYGITSFSGAVTKTTEDGGEVSVSEFSNVFQAGYAKSRKTEGSVSEDDEEDLGPKVYGCYDFFDATYYTSTTTFSGVMFKAAAYNCNRVRLGTYTATTSKENTHWDNWGVFFSTTSNVEDRQEEVASQIDFAFSNALRVKNPRGQNISGDEASWAIGGTFISPYGAIINARLAKINSFSKYNVGLVWYYYNLWAFNFLLGYAGIIAFLIVMGNITFGMITRLIRMLALFFVFPPLIGIAPLDDGNAFKQWKKQFLSDTLMAYGAIIGINIFFLILPFLNSLSFFNNVVLDTLLNTIIMLAGLTMVQGLIKMLSGFIGGGDANATGADTMKATKELASKGLQKTLGAATVGVKVAKFGVGGAIGLGKGAIAAGAGIAGKIGETQAWQNHLLNQQYRQAKRQHKSEEAYMQRERKKLGLDKHDTSRDNEILRAKEDKAEAKELKRQERHDNRVQRVEAFKNSKFSQGMIKVGQGVKKVGRGVTGGFALAMNADVKRKEDGTIDTRQTWKGVGQAFVDISKLSLKTVGKVTGASKIIGDTEKDSFKTFFQSVVLPYGATKAADVPKGLRTKDQKDDIKKDEAKEQGTYLRSSAESNAKTEQSLQELIRLLQDRL